MPDRVGPSVRLMLMHAEACLVAAGNALPADPEGALDDVSAARLLLSTALLVAHYDRLF